MSGRKTREITSELADSLERALNFLDGREFIGEALNEVRDIIEEGKVYLKKWDEAEKHRKLMQTSKKT